MEVGLLVAVAALVFGWSVVSARLERFDVTGPIVFVVAGVLLCDGRYQLFEVAVTTEAVHAPGAAIRPTSPFGRHRDR